MADFFEVHDGADVAARASAAEIKRHLAEVVVVADGGALARMQIADRARLLLLHLFDQAARVHHHVGPGGLASRLQICFVMKALFILELINDSGVRL